MKYYMKRNAGRPLVIGESTFTFIICEQLAGTWFGVLKTEDEAEIELLDKAVEEGKLQEVDQKTYELRIKNRSVHRPGVVVESAGTATRDPSAKAKPAQVESVKDATVSDDDMNATATIGTGEEETYAPNLKALAAELNMTDPELESLRKIEGCPKSTGKGYRIASFLDFIATQEASK